MSNDRLRKLFKHYVKRENCVYRSKHIEDAVMDWVVENVEMEIFRPCVGILEQCKCETIKSNVRMYEHYWNDEDGTCEMERWLVLYLCPVCHSWEISDYVPDSENEMFDY